MSMDKRVDTKFKPTLGCHSSFDHLHTIARPPCNWPHKHEEKACIDCKRQEEVNEPAITGA